MKTGIPISVTILYLLMLGSFAGLMGCANMVPPSGGAIDSLPPRLVRSFPKDSALQFNGNKLLLQFDEFIELKNPNDEIVISPYPAQQPLINSNLKSVSIKLKDSLLPNTTYTVHFGNAIADINEGNVLKDFQFSFSTGKQLDTNSLSGTVLMAETGKADSTLWALLYREDEDSTVAKKNPAYITKVDGNGYFQFRHLPEGKFYVYALKDADGNKKYNQPIEAFAFSDQPMIISGDAISPNLYAFATEKETKRERARELKRTDKLIFTNNLQDGALELTDTLMLQANEKLVFFDGSQIQLKEDTLEYKKLSSLRYDSVRKKIYVTTPLKPGARYQLVLPKEFARDSSGRMPAKNDTLRFRVKTEKEYGTLKITFRQADLSQNPVVQLIQNEQIMYRLALQSNECYIKLCKPGSYQLQLLYDRNRNGIWDAGDYFSKPRRQPERVQHIDKEILIKQNWDNEWDIVLPGN
jgi:uncharacterized protein (DUF2141 family)